MQGFHKRSFYLFYCSILCSIKFVCKKSRGIFCGWGFRTALLYVFLPSSRKVFIRDLSLSWLSFPSVLVGDPLLSKEKNDRFPNAPRRQTFGNDGFLKKEVILNLVQDLPIGLSSGLLFNKVILEGFCPVSNPYFITTDPGLRLSRMTTTANDPRCRFWKPCGPPVQYDGKKCSFVVAFPSLFFKGLLSFFFLLKFEYSAVGVPGCIRRIKMCIKGRFA